MTCKDKLSIILIITKRQSSLLMRHPGVMWETQVKVERFIEVTTESDVEEVSQ